MFVVLTEKGGIKNVANIMYGKDIEAVKDWVYQYLIKEIEIIGSLMMSNTIGYKIVEISNNKYSIVREIKQVIPGYIYNSYKKSFETMLECSILEYKDTSLQKNKKKFLEQYHNTVANLKENSLTSNIKEKNE